MGDAEHVLAEVYYDFCWDGRSDESLLLERAAKFALVAAQALRDAGLLLEVAS